MAKYPGVSVVICCHNSAAHLPQTLPYLARQQVESPAIRWEVILIDNASTDQTAAVARQQWPADAPAPLRVVHEPQLGLIHARLRGLAEATYELVSFVDDDNRVCLGWIQVVAELMRSRQDVGACGGPSRPVSDKRLPTWFAKYSGHYAAGEQSLCSGDITATRGYLWGAGLTVRKLAWEQVQAAGFVPLLIGRNGQRLTSGEDTELCYALRLAGWRLWYDSRLQLDHYLPAYRLTWDYLRQLHHEDGTAFALLTLYRQALQPSATLSDHLRKSWVLQLVSAAGYCLLNHGLRRWAGRETKAAKQAELYSAFYQGKFMALLQHRHDYGPFRQRIQSVMESLQRVADCELSSKRV